jgi:hypothetical protein
VFVTHTDVNIFTQIGFVVLVGLASKNAVLIVEFAKHKHEEGGRSRREAALEACRLRLRPILMTSFAFILGVVPLLTASGAGSEMRHSLGLAVFAGMLGVTLFGIFLTPVFFYVIESLVEAPLFTSARARQVGIVMLYVLGVLTLGLPWLLRLLLGKPVRRPAPATNGTAGPHHQLPIVARSPDRATDATEGLLFDTTGDLRSGQVARSPDRATTSEDPATTSGNGNGNGHPASPEGDPERVAQK